MGACRGGIIIGAGVEYVRAWSAQYNDRIAPVSSGHTRGDAKGSLGVHLVRALLREATKAVDWWTGGEGSIRVELHTPLRALRWPLAACLLPVLLLASGCCFSHR